MRKGLNGSQAQYVRVPLADATLLPVSVCVAGTVLWRYNPYIIIFCTSGFIAP